MKYKSCFLLEHGISINKNKIESCCIVNKDNSGHPLLINNYNGERIDWQELIKIKREAIKAQQKTGYPPCKNCLSLIENDWEQEDYITNINFNHWSNCNSNCVYCSSVFHNSNTQYSILPWIKELIKLNLFKQGGDITFQGGEPTLLKEFDEIVELFLNLNTKIRVHSSGILYSKSIEEGIKKGLLTVIISPDSGEKRLYEKIKRVPCFEKVWKNIKTYKETSKQVGSHLVCVKYIIIPGINDSIKDLDNWFYMVKKSDVKNVMVNLEYLYAKYNKSNYSEHIFLLMDYIRDKAEKLGLNCEFIESCIEAENLRKYKGMRYLLNFKPLYSGVMNIIKKRNKYKNIDYNDLSLF